MEALRRLARNAKGLDSGIIFKNFFDQKDIKSLIIRLNTEGEIGSQLENSILSTGLPIVNVFSGRSTYSQTTEDLTDGRKEAGRPYTLKDTGEFYDSWRVKVTEKEIIITADGDKDAQTDLLYDYTIDVLGLTDDNLQFIIDLFGDEISKTILEEICK